jgi:hypothetical protein
MSSEHIKTTARPPSLREQNLINLGGSLLTSDKTGAPMSIFIPGEVPSSKNSRQVVKRGGKTRVIVSDFCKRYIENTRMIYKMAEPFFRQMIPYDPPLFVSFYFIRRTHGIFDYTNIAQIVQDMMVQAEWIPDDRMSQLIPFFIPYKKDKDKPGVWISILDNSIYER